MKVHGYEIPAELEASAIAWMRGAPFAVWSLTGFLDLRLPACGELIAAGATVGRSIIAFRAADRLVQRERKAGRIEIADRRRSPVWRWVDGAA